MTTDPNQQPSDGLALDADRLIGRLRSELEASSFERIKLATLAEQLRSDNIALANENAQLRLALTEKTRLVIDDDNGESTTEPAPVSDDRP